MSILPNSTVLVTAINFNVNPGNADYLHCVAGGPGTLLSNTRSGGFMPHGARFSVNYSLTFTYDSGFGVTNCTLYNLTVQPSAFTLITANAPLTIQAGTTQTLTVTIQAPDVDYAGVVTISVTIRGN